MSLSALVEGLGKLPGLFKEHPIYTVVGVIILCVVGILWYYPELRMKWMEYEEKRNKTAGKRRKTTKKLDSRIVAVVIVVTFVLFLVFYMIFNALGNNGGGSRTTDSSDSSSKGPEESSVDPVEESSYVVVQADISWSDAEKACENDGGHLATITGREEYKQVVATLESYIQENGSSAENIFYVWLGGWNEDSDSKRGINNYEWITGEEWDHDEIDFFWCNTVSDNGTQISEPSFIDENTGDIENRLVLWKHETSVLWDQEPVILNWTFSDQNDDFLNLPDVSSVVKGRIAYICEYND